MVQKSDDINKKHFDLLLWVIIVLGSALISTILFVYFSNIEQLKDRDEIQMKQHKELMQVVARNQHELTEIKKIILIKFGIDIDKEADQRQWEKLIQEFNSQPRGNNILKPFEDIAKIIYH